jgi:hypothetical protein
MRESDPSRDEPRRPSQPDPTATRGRLRVWLKTALQTGLLDRVPAHYTPASRPTLEYALDLLAEIQAADLSSHPPAKLLAEIRAFRAWVEERQRHSRRLMLAESSQEDGRSYRLGSPKKDPAPPDPPPQRRRPDPDPPLELDPMWDRWLDG